MMNLKTRGYLKIALGIILSILAAVSFVSGGKDVSLSKLGATKLGHKMGE